MFDDLWHSIQFEQAFVYTDGILGWEEKGDTFCPHPKARFLVGSIYFLFNSIVGGLVLVNLFIGLMCSAMFNSVRSLDYENEIDKKLQVTREQNLTYTSFFSAYFNSHRSI